MFVKLLVILGTFICSINKIECQTPLKRIPVRLTAKYDSNDNLEFFPAIIGGVPVAAGEFPAHVSLQTRRGHHICGGTLIDFDYVLTAAHCVTNTLGQKSKAEDFKVMGDDITIVKNGSPTRQVKNVLYIFVHPQYDAGNLLNDIAVLKTDMFHESSTLHVAETASDPPQTGAHCTMAGWGTQHENTTKPNPVLFKAEVVVSDVHQCNRSYSGLVSEGMFCAVGDRQDSCLGDSGGALLCNGKVSGIVSFGNGCDNPGYPGVYVDVVHYSDFIDDSFRTPVAVSKHEDAAGSATQMTITLMTLLAVYVTIMLNN